MRVENEIVINKSRFIGIAVSLENENQIKQVLEEIKKEHKKATHICFAYVYNKTMVLEKAFDDGEPKGTAGMPILNVIKKRGEQNVMVVVIRYFGGIKLGAGGVLRAYTKCASEVLIKFDEKWYKIMKNIKISKKINKKRFFIF